MDTISLSKFIEQVGDDEAARLFGAKVRTVESWRRGERMPRSRDIPELIKKSGYRLSYDSFFEDAA